MMRSFKRATSPLSTSPDGRKPIRGPESGSGSRIALRASGKVAVLLALLTTYTAFFAPPAHAQTPPTLDILQRADGARIVPDRFLRSWDPVTIFFDRDAGPAKGGPEDDPRRFVTTEPAVAGAWQWLGPRALQFRPADPWKPLANVRFKGEGFDTRLVPLLPVPASSDPAENADPVTDLDHVILTFADPVDVATLSRLLQVEVRPAPGLDAKGGLMLGPQDVSVRPLARAKAGAQQSYLVQFKQAVPDSRVAIVRLKLSDQPGLDDPTWELKIRSAEPFAATKIACGRGLDDQTVGTLLRCTPYAASSDEDGESKPKGTKRSLSISFSAKPEALDIVRARDALRISPPVDGLAVERDGSRLRVSAKFLADTVYDIRIAAGALSDERKRVLAGAFAGQIAFAADKPALVWDSNDGIVERLGPQIVPMRGNGYDKVDLRIHRIDPVARDFWPFPSDGLETDEADAPPLPGNEPKKWTDATDADGDAMKARLKALGSPAVSELVTLPIPRGGVAAKFGLDLKPWFTRIAGEGQPGTYLVGMRTVDGATRDWMRVQVTDLTLSTVEETSRVKFAVTSLSTAQPIADADIKLEGLRDDKFVTLVSGRTDKDGGFIWDAANRKDAEIKRIVVSKGLDTLVLEPDPGPAQYAQQNWTKPEDPWLAWTVDEEADRSEKPRTLCHVFTERPIYRPEEPVHIKGYVRSYRGGALSYAAGKGTVVVAGPANQEWRVPVTLDATGNFYHRFDAQTPATGDYQVKYEPDRLKAKETEKKDKADDAAEDKADNDDESGAAQPETAADDGSCGSVPFKKEAYRLPTFEVLLHAPERTPLDAPFNVDLIARYFAGGLVGSRPIKWRASQFPYTWSPPGREGWFFSSDARFSTDGAFKATPVLERDSTTDAGGSARISFDPTIEPTAQPRRYQIEATVTGEDDVQVRNVTSVIALPAFVLGVKIPRYLPQAGSFEPEILAVDAEGKPLEGLELTVRFIRRNWSSVLQASDFAQGSAKYVTEVIDETITERKITSAKDAQKLAFETREAGVYLVQVEASDRIGRRQQISVDTFVGGDTPVTWARAPSQTAEVTTDKDAYAPGETATLVIQSPFQTARALAVVEEPEGRFRYDWVDIANGFGRYPVTVRKEEMPKVPVHFLIMRGRLPATASDPTAPFDQGKPVTIAATKWVNVTPVKNIVVAKLEAPAKARPAQEIEVTLRLADDTGKPLAGEATFWMIDQAVLSLAKERPLDPLKDFIVDRPTTMAARDTRNMAFGIIPLEEVPGGDAGLDEWGTDSNVSVRKNFTPVPIYLPKVLVGPDGVAKITVKLPDSLTVFKLRAKAIAGPDRFGYATGDLLVRQELVAQPALPRFVRPGDTFDASLIGRVVEGPSGTGRLTLAANGLTLTGASEQAFAWQQNAPARLAFPVSVPEASEGAVRLRFGLSRDADKASDNVEIALPVRPDREPMKTRQIADVPANGALPLPAAIAAARPGTYARDVTLALDPALVRLIAGLDAMIEYPFGCTEQRISLASAGLALKPFTPIMAATGFDKRISVDVRNTLQAIAQAVDPNDLVAFWPKAKGNVSLTAWSYAFWNAAKKAGEPVDAALGERLANVLKLSLRSDYGRLIVGDELRERVEALTALADGGQLDGAYVAELARRADSMPNQSVAQMARVVATLPGDDRRVVMSLIDTMWTRVQVLSRNGRPYYAGQAAERANPVILPSEARSLAEMTRAVAVATPDDTRLMLLRDGLMRIGGGDGWGSVNATSAAIRALADAWRRPVAALPATLTIGAASQTLTVSGETPVARAAANGDGRIENRGNAALVALIDTRWKPIEPGAKAQPVSNGFVVTRESFKVPAQGAPERLSPDANGAIGLKVGDVIEEVVEIANPEDRTHVAIALPLAAGMEPLNPNLANSPAEAAPSAEPTLPPTWTAFEDDKVFYAYDVLPKGNYRFVYRTRAQISGSFTQPPGEAELMYKAGVMGASAGKRVVIGR